MPRIWQSLAIIVAICLPGFFSVDSTSLGQPPQSPPETALGNAGNEEVARIMREFAGRGDLGDEAPALSPQQTIASLKVAEDLKISLVASEPDIAQPIHISFDDRGRMWVVLYRQYPFPEGLKVVRYDQHLRAVFDRVPAPPPHDVRGADTVVVFEDTDGDGDYDSQHESIGGLNIATSAAVGRSGIWVMNPPYLLFYPDADRDTIPDSDPIVHLSGFGLEDTHSVANSLMFAPDGWLYGVNGSTTTANVHVHLGNQPDTSYQGQCVWRYQPETNVFEIYAEGGGNPFGLEFDRSGRVFSGTNGGNTRGMYYPQGSYGVKNWGKHGPLTNPYAFGFFQHMGFEGDARRFTEEFVIYDDVRLPKRYHGKMLSINPLQRIAFASHVIGDGSTFRTQDFENLITSEDRWFRPVDATVGPDGNLYIADWYDTRLTHVDPRDNWHKSSGRIYRLATQNQQPIEPPFLDILPSTTRFDLQSLDDEALIELLGHPGRWFRFAAIEELVRRNSTPTGQRLLESARSGDDPRALEALWACSRILGTKSIITSSDALHDLLHHADPDVRRWAVRLIGDRRSDEPALRTPLCELAVEENDPAVRSQLASTAARLPHPLGPALAIAMLRSAGEIDAADPHIPLLLWWAIEAHFGQAKPLLCTELLNGPALWDAPIIRSTILSRFAQRCALDGRSEPLVWCAELLASAPDSECRSQLFLGLDEGLAQITGAELPDELTNIMQRFRAEMPQTDLKLRLRSGDPGAVDEALAAVMSLQTRVGDRIDLINVLGELQTAGAARVCIALLSDASIPVRRAALNAVARFPEPSAGDAIANAYQSSMDDSTGLRPIAIRVMSSRLPWARSLIREIDSLRINAELVTPDLVRQMQSFDDKVLNQSIERLWGTVRESSEEKQNQILALRHQVQTLVGDVERGRKLYNDRCGKCHQLFGEGGQVGPNLTGYERTNFDFLAVAIVDPSAAIREEFTQYQVLTSDGQVIAGLLVGQTPRLLTIRTAENQTVNIQREQVDSFAASPISLMPEGLLEDLSDQQKVDLLTYIAK